MLQIIDEPTGSVLWDFDDPTGIANPHGLKTRIDDLDIGEPEFDEVTFPASSGSRVVWRQARRAVMTWTMRVDPYDSVDEGLFGVRELGYLLEAGGVMKYKPDGATQARFIDYLPASSQPLIRGQPRGLLKILKLLQDPDGGAFEVRRQPFLRGDELDSAVNKLVNPTLLLDSDGAGLPDGWTSAGGTHSIVAADNAYQNSHGAISDLLRQDVSASNGQTWTLSGEARRVSGNGVGRLRLSSVGGTATDDSADIDSDDWEAFSVTVTMNASTTAARAILRQHTASGTTVFQFRLLQLEQAATATLWVPGEQLVPNDPASSGGRVFPVYIHGDAPAPVSVRVAAPGSNAPRSVLVGVQDGALLANYLNTRKILQAEAGTPGTNTALYVDSSASPGSGNSAMETSFTTSNDLTVDRVNWSVLTLLDALEGLVDVWARIRTNSAPSSFLIELLDYDSVQSWSRVGFRQLTLTDTDYIDFRLGQLQRPKGSAAWNVKLRYMRSSGAGLLRVDHLLLVPSAQLCAIDVVSSISPSDHALVTDPEADDVRHESNAGVLPVPTVMGPIPARLSPGPGALVFAFGQAAIAAGRIGKTTLGTTPPVSIRYSPRYYQ